MTEESILEIEDWLNESGVFYNGISGGKSHSDSYMTCVDFVKLGAAISRCSSSEEEIKLAVDYWLTNANVQQPLRLVALEWRRKL